MTVSLQALLTLMGAGRLTPDDRPEGFKETQGQADGRQRSPEEDLRF